MRWIVRQFRLWRWKRLLWKMIRAMKREGWDPEDVQSVLLHIGGGGEVEVLTPSVKERLGAGWAGSGEK